MDKQVLTEYDSIVIVDRSGSMGTPTPRFPSRWDEAKEMAIGIATLAAQVDEDGITLIACGGTFVPSRDVVDGVKADAVATLFDNQSPHGSTPTGLALQAAFKKKFEAGKKAVIFVITDGVPDSHTDVENAIVAASQRIKDATEVRVIFVQVGDDKAAQKWLNDIDSSIRGAKFDIVNAVDFESANGLTPLELYDRAINDSH